MYLWPGRKEEVSVLNCSSAELQVGIQTTVTQSHHVPSAFQREDPAILFANIEPFSKGVPQQKKTKYPTTRGMYTFHQKHIITQLHADWQKRQVRVIRHLQLQFTCEVREPRCNHPRLKAMEWPKWGWRRPGNLKSTCHMIFTQPSDIVCLCMQFWIWRGRALQVERPLGMP